MFLTVIGGIALFVLTLLVGVLTNMISNDVEKRAPRWAAALITVAVNRLPLHLQDRYREEWEGDLAEGQSPLSQLLFAFGLLTAARRIGIAERQRTTPCLLSSRARVQKRILDIAFASTAIVSVGPILLAMAILLKLERRGPVLVRYERVGLGSRTFSMVKFRSIYLDTEGNMRATRLGRFLRKTSLDELPLLLNVLAGDMAIVGPPPKLPAPACNDRYADVNHGAALEAVVRHEVKPGMTWAAGTPTSRGKTHADDDQADQADAEIEYAQGWSIWRDITVIAGTVAQVLRGNGTVSPQDPADDS